MLQMKYLGQSVVVILIFYSPDTYYLWGGGFPLNMVNVLLTSTQEGFWVCVLVLAAGVNYIADISSAAFGAVLVTDGELNASSAVPYYDPNNTGEITEMRQYVFTEWGPTAISYMEALAAVFDTNGDGVLDASDGAFVEFRLLVANANSWAGIVMNTIVQCWADRVLLSNTA